MIDPDTIREIQRLMDENRVNEHRIARLLGIDAAALRELPAGNRDETALPGTGGWDSGGEGAPV
jgi:hypothetical protein